jgi:uncharacterized protein YbaR (Trm112 family)
MAIRREVLEILVCPRCKGDLKLTEKPAKGEEDGFVCGKCKLLYPIRDGIPVMLISEAIKVGIKND